MEPEVKAAIIGAIITGIIGGIFLLLSVWFKRWLDFRREQRKQVIPTKFQSENEQHKREQVAESEIREQNRELIKDVIADIETRYQNALNQLPIIDKLDKYQPNNGLGIAVLLHIKFNDKNKLEIVFWLNDGLHEFSTTEKLVKHSIGKKCDGVCAEQAWLKRNLQDTFPNADFTVTGKKDYVIFYEETFYSQTSREELENTFKTTVFEILDKLLPKLVQLHKDGIL
jgi:hypothetical protein